MANTTFTGPVRSLNGFVNLSDNNKGVTITAPGSLAANYTLTLPADDGTNGQFLKTDGTGVLSWGAGDGTGTVTSIATAGTVNGLTLTGGTITTTGTITLGGALDLTTFTGKIATALTGASATPGTNRAVYGKYTTFTSMTSGNLVGVRGEITLGGNASGTAYLYGTQGKIITGSNTIDVGSSYVAAVFAQYDATGATITSGYNCAVAADIFGVSSGTKAIDMFYGQHADGGTINAYLRAYGKATTVFEFDTNGGAQAGTTESTATAAGFLKVIVDGATRYIQLYSGTPS